MAVSSNIGQLTLDLVANTGGFTAPIDQAARALKKQMKELGVSVDEFGNYTDKAMRKAADSTKQLDSQFEKISESLQREAALYGDTSRAAQMRYDLEKGALQTLSSAQKDALTDMARRISAMESANAAFREQAAEIAKVNGLYAQQESAMRREIALYGETSREAKIRYEIERGALATLSKDKQFKLLLDARALDVMDAEAAKSKQLAAATKQLDAQHEQLNESMLAQLATYGNVTRVAKLRYDMERGALKGLTEAQKQSSLQLAQQLDSLDKAALGSMRGIRGVATGIGYQMQDIAVQLQMGTNPLMVFAQQGSQIASLFGPTGAVAGAVIAIGGALAGALIPNLFKTGEAAKEVSDKVAGLVSEMDKLDAAQRQVVETANRYRISDKQKEYDELTKSIAEQRTEVERLTAAQGKRQGPDAAVSFGTLGLAAGSTSVGVNLVESLAKATRDLNSVQVQRVAVEKELQELQDLAGAREILDNLRREIDLIGLLSKELYLKEAAQKSLVGWQAQEYVQLKLNEEQRKASAKADEDAAKAREDAAKKALEDEKSRADSIAKTISGMEREIALYGVTSKAAQTEYDILNGILKVKGGLEGVEGRRLLQAARAQDAQLREKEAQDEYVEKMKEWVKGENDKVAAKDKILQALKDEEAQLSLTADAYLKLQLQSKGATDAEVADALQRAQRIRERKAQLEEMESAQKDLAQRTQEMWNRIDAAAADAWSNMMDGTKSSLSSIADMFKKTLAEMAHEAITKPILMQFRNQVSSVGVGNGSSIAGYTGQAYQNWASGGSSTSSGSGAATSAIGMGGIYAAGAAVAIAAVNSWNKKQDEKFEKMTAAYRQGTQSTGTLLGMANAKSDSISQALSNMGDLSGDVLDVNRDMYMALLAIETGINGVAAGFARQFGITGEGGDFSYVQQGTEAGVTRLGNTRVFKEIERWGSQIDIIGGDFITAFAGGIMDSINKEVFKKKTKIIDSGIQFMGSSLADILAAGTIEAFAYADVQTTKKFLGVTTSNKVKTETQSLNDVLLSQFASVFSNAGDALGLAAEAFGMEFDDYINRLVVDPQKLSLKDLEGGELTKEIEAFFSSTLDGWASVLVGGSDILLKFQEVGEGAFETVLRLASELNTFNSYMDAVGVEFNLTGFAAVEASQNIAKFAGGMDQLSNSLNSYYTEFFSENERFIKQTSMLKEAFGELGYTSVPETHEQFKALVNAIDLTTEAGQKQFASLIALAGVTDEYVDALDKQRDALNDAITKAFSGLSEAVQRERDLLDKANQEAMDAIEKSLSKHRSLADGLKSALESLTPSTAQTALIDRQRAQAQLAAANAAYLRTGNLPEIEDLEDALRAISQPSSQFFSSYEDYARDLAAARRNVSSLENAASGRVTIEEKMLTEQESYYDAESKRFDTLIEYYEEQVKIATGSATTLLSISDAINVLATAFSDAGLELNKSVPAPVAIAADRVSIPVVPSTVAGDNAVDELKKMREDLEVSQFALAKFNKKMSDILERWDRDGVPEVREEL